jgi:hypothetical protein
MVFTYNQFVIFDLFGATPSFYFFNNSAIILLSLKSKQLEPLVQGLYDNFNIAMNT